MAERRLRWLRPVFLALLAALVAVRRGAPGASTLLAIAGLLLAFVAVRAVVLRLRRFPRDLVPALVAIALLSGAGVVVGLLGARDELELAWVLLAGVPLALWLGLPGSPLVPRSAALAGLLFGAVALGLLAIEPWEDPIGRILLAAIGLVGVVIAVLDAGKAAVPAGLPAAPARARRRAVTTALFVAVFALLASLGVENALRGIPQRWKEEPPPDPAEDPLTQRVQPVELGDVAGELALALVRVVDESIPEREIPRLLYLRERVLDEPVDSDELLYLGPRSGPTALRRDEDDGAADRRVRLQDAVSAAAGLELQITLLREEPRALLVPPRLDWLEGDSLTVGPDLAIARPNGPAAAFGYRAAGDPRGAFAPPREGIQSAAANAPLLALPPSFAGRQALEAMVAALSAGHEDDLGKVQAFATHLRSTGRLDERAPFRGWDDFARGRAGGPLHFAQCLALLSRLARVPSRVAAGYCTAAWFEHDRRFEVRGHDLHYWTEVELEGLGWIDLDPSPLPPDLDPDLAGAEEPLLPERTDPATVREAIARERPYVLGLLLLLFLAALLAFPALRFDVERVLGPRPPQGAGAAARRAWRYWQELIDCCRRHGIFAHPAWTAEEFAQVVNAAAPSEGRGIVTLLRVYHSCRFGGGDLSPEEERSSRELLVRLPAALEGWKSRRPELAPSRR